MAQIDLPTLNLMPRILSNDTLDKNNEIIINTATNNGETTVLSQQPPPPLLSLSSNPSSSPPSPLNTTSSSASSTTSTSAQARPVPELSSSRTQFREQANHRNSYENQHGGHGSSSNASNTSSSGSSSDSGNLTSSLTTNERHKKCQYHCSNGGRQHNHNHHHRSQGSLVSPREAGQRYLQAAAAGTATAAVSQQQQQDVVNEQKLTTSTTTSSASSTLATSSSSPPRNSSLINDRYMLLDLVEGSTLFKCIDVKTNSDHVCKVAVKPCTNLLTAHFRLDGHPHVNQIEKVIDCNEKSYLFFNPSEGDLHSYVRVRKRLRENEARHLFKQMCNVVDSCHQEGIILRDLKLRKFVFEDAKSLHLKLETLEDAVVLNDPDNDLLYDRRGCPAYVSPEILRAHSRYSGKAADMWSLGVILYTMLVGRYPFNDTEHTALFAKISRGQYVVPDCLSAKARCIIRALLRRDPEERITSSDVLFHPWLKADCSRDNCRGLSSKDDQLVPQWKPSELEQHQQQQQQQNQQQ